MFGLRTLAKTAPRQGRTMATLSDIKLRMRSVSNIQKITKSMKMVAASKLRSVQTAMEDARPFGASTRPAFTRFSDDAAGGAADGSDAAAPAGDILDASADGSANRLVVCAITSDKGLCGAINSAVVKATRAAIAGARASGAEVDLFVIGEKGRAALTRDASDSISAVVTEVGKTPTTFVEASLIAERLAERAGSGKIVMVSNVFKSAIAYDTITAEIPSLQALESKLEAISAGFNFESDCLADLYEFHLATTLYSSLLENATSEQSARMTAMDNAATNAGDMLGKLSLVYNRTRQAVITRELIEIISGADSVQG